MPAPDKVAPGRGLRSRTASLLAFSFAVTADPVSSVAYAIEAALRALNGDLALLVPTMLLVVAIIALVITPYWGVVLFIALACAVTAAAGGIDKDLVLVAAGAEEIPE